MYKGGNDDDVDISKNSVPAVSNDIECEILCRFPVKSRMRFKSVCKRWRSLIRDDILWEILSRLPVKSLMRFKCICKRWLSFIQHDPDFRDLHLTRSRKTRPHLLMVVKGKSPYFLSGDLLSECRAIFDTRWSPVHPIWRSRTMSFNSLEMLKPVNGLMCFVNYVGDAVCIYNHSTREVTGWIKTTITKEIGCGVAGQHHPTYEFGFDPATKKHKVICLWSDRRDTNSNTVCDACEILTVGENSWRRINEVPPETKGRSVYLNGTIYWTSNNYQFIVAFDVGREKFRVITIPYFFRYKEPRDEPPVYGSSFSLLEVDGRVALSHRHSSYTVKLWLFDDDYHKKERIRSTITNWTELTITLPFSWGGPGDGHCVDLRFHGIAGTNEIIIESYRDIFNITNWYSKLYSYNWKKRIFKEVGNNAFSLLQNPHDAHCLFATFEESLYPVQKYKEQHHTQPPPRSEVACAMLGGPHRIPP